MINFACKHEFRQSAKRITKPLTQKHSDVIQDDDTLMSADDLPDGSCENPQRERPTNCFSSPINIQRSLESGFTTTNVPNDNNKDELSAEHINNYPLRQNIESEMSGETSNVCLTSPCTQSKEVREIRAGCRRVREDRPGYSIGFNEDLLK